MTKRQQYIREVQELLREPEVDDPELAYTEAEAVFLEVAAQIGRPRITTVLPQWEYLNKFLSGLSPYEFSILCGPTGAGKTTLLASWALDLISSSIPTYIAPVEIGSAEFVKKMIGALAFKSFESISEQERDALKRNIYPILGSTLMVFANYDSRVNHITMLADLLHAHKERGVKVALIDNLNFMMEVTKSADQIIQMDRTVHDFVIFCKKIPMHIVMVMHPRKTENGRITSEFDIKGSATSVQEACNVLLFNRLEDAEHAPMGVDPKFCREIIVAKSRYNGRSVGRKIILALHDKSELLREVGYV